MKANKDPQNRAKLLGVILFIAVITVGYLYFPINKDALPPQLQLSQTATQGFIKDQDLGFLVPTAQDDKLFTENVKDWQSAKITPTSLARTANNKGMHYLYWDGSLSDYASFRDVLDNTNPSKAKMLFTAKWNSVKNWFDTTPHNFYKKTDDKGNTLTNVLEVSDLYKVLIGKSEGLIFASADSTEIYGFKDGNTFAKSPYGICDKIDKKTPGWHLFAAETANLTQLFKECLDGEINSVFKQTSINPVTFEQVTDFSKPLQYSMLWVNKDVLVQPWNPNPPVTSKDHVYTLDKNTLKVDFNDGTTESYQLYLYPKDTIITLTDNGQGDSYLTMDTKAGSYIGKFEFDQGSKEFTSDLQDSYKDMYEVTSDDYSTYGLSKNTIAVLNKTVDKGFKWISTPAVENSATMLISPEEGLNTKQIDVVTYNVYESKKEDIAKAKLLYTVDVDYQNNKVLKKATGVEVEFQKNDIQFTVSGLKYETTYTFQVSASVDAQDEKGLVTGQTPTLVFEIPTGKKKEVLVDHTYKVEGNTLTVNFMDGSNGTYPLYLYPLDLVAKEAVGGTGFKPNDAHVKLSTKDGQEIGYLEFDEKTNAFTSTVYKENPEYTVYLGDLTEKGLSKNTISVVYLNQDIPAPTNSEVIATKNSLSMVIMPPQGNKGKQLWMANIDVFEKDQDSDPAQKVVLYWAQANYDDKSINQDQKTKLFDIKFDDNDDNLNTTLSGLKEDTSYTFKVMYQIHSSDEKQLMLAQSKPLLFTAKTVAPEDTSTFKAGDEVLVKQNATTNVWHSAVVVEEVGPQDGFKQYTVTGTFGNILGMNSTITVNSSTMNSKKHPTAVTVGQKVISKRSGILSSWMEDAEVTAVNKVDEIYNITVKFTDGATNLGGLFGFGAYTLTLNDLYEKDPTT